MVVASLDGDNGLVDDAGYIFLGHERHRDVAGDRIKV